MARSKTKTGGAAAGAPRPRIEPKQPPLLRQRWLRRTVLVLLALLGIWIGTTVWAAMSRSNALRSYDEALFRAQQPFFAHVEPGTDTNIDQVHQGFSEGAVTAKRLEELAGTWEKDFTAARDAVRGLDPDTSGEEIPSEVVDANGLIAESLEMYAGVAKMYVVAAGQKRLAAVADGAAERTQLEEQLQRLLTGISEWRERAARTHSLGTRRIEILREAWGVKDGRQLEPSGGAPGAPAEIPGLDTGP